MDRNFYIKWAYCLWFTSMTTLDNSSCVISNQRCNNPNTLGNKSYTSRYSYYAAMALEQWSRCSDIYEKRSQYPQYWDYDIPLFIRISKWISYSFVRSTIQILASYVTTFFQKSMSEESFNNNVKNKWSTCELWSTFFTGLFGTSNQYYKQRKSFTLQFRK